MLGRSSPGYTVRGYGVRGYRAPRPGAFAGRSRSLLSRAFARNSVLRQMDWVLVVVVSGLSAIGVLLVWSATQPSLLAAGQDPRTYLKKQLLWALLGLILMFAVSFADSTSRERKCFSTNVPSTRPMRSFCVGMMAVCGIGSPSGRRNRAVTANQSAKPPTRDASAVARTNPNHG